MNVCVILCLWSHFIRQAASCNIFWVSVSVSVSRPCPCPSCALFALPVTVHLGAPYCGVAVGTFAHILQNHYLNTQGERGEKEKDKSEESVRQVSSVQ